MAEEEEPDGPEEAPSDAPGQAADEPVAAEETPPLSREAVPEAGPEAQDVELPAPASMEHPAAPSAAAAEPPPNVELPTEIPALETDPTLPPNYFRAAGDPDEEDLPAEVTLLARLQDRWQRIRERAPPRPGARQILGIGKMRMPMAAVLAMGGVAQAQVLGGGVGAAPGRYWTSFRAALPRFAWGRYARRVRVRRARLGARGGMIGAALSAVEGSTAR